MIPTNARKHPPTSHHPALPTLPIALHAEPMTAPLSSLLLPLWRTSGTLTVTQARLLDYKPGRRGLIRYDVAAADGAEAWTVFGKFYAESVQAARVHEIMQLLWADIFAGETHLGVPQPLGCIADQPMLLYLPIAGRFLDKRIPSAQLIHGMKLAGMWLASLHQYRPALDRQIQLATELVKLQSWSVLVGHSYSEQAEAAIQLYRYLHERAGDLGLEANVPIHKDFHYGHLIVNGRLNVIDFDEVRLGDPNFDLAHFCAYLNLLVYRKSRSFLTYSRLESAFLGAYAERTGWAPDERFIYFYVYTCLKIAWQLCAGSGPHPRPRGQEQRRQVRLILKRGLAALSHGLGISRTIATTGNLERFV
jgi:hypothetical protein